MGQVKTVQVHRLITPDSVDERMREILREKSELFARYAAQSEVANASPEAVDITESEVVQRVLDEEIARRKEEIDARGRRRDKRTAPSGRDVPGPRLTDGIPVAVDLRAGDDTGDEPIARRLRSSPGRDVQPPPRAAPRAEPSPASRPLRQAETCGACGRPYDVNGHCGCS
jgi:hypothetical protein